MQTTTTGYNTAITAPVRSTTAKVELYSGSTLVQTYTQANSIKSITIERAGENSKFFGFCVGQKLSLHLIDTQRSINVSTANTLKVYIGVGSNGAQNYFGFPTFYVTEVNRDENTNELSITAYDLIDEAKKHTVSEITLAAPYTLREFANACGTLLGVSVSGTNGSEWATSYADGANFDGTENIRDALTMLAEATQSICFMGADNTLRFKRLGGSSVLSITRNDYITLTSGHNRRLQTICSCTELGDNVSESTSLTGTTQYVRENAFWNMRDDVATLVHNAVSAVGNMTINQFECEWRGNPALECGDKITFTTKDNSTITSYLLNDTINYDGALSETTSWHYEDNNSETESNPTTISEAIVQTVAKVDKVDKRITLEVGALDNGISNIILEQDLINASVTSLQQNINEQNELNEEQISTLTKKVEASMTSDAVEIAINTAMTNINAVETTTGFRFDDSGLNISKTGSEMSTNINEDGMVISRNNSEVLKADNTGVNAMNLTSRQYLIIGGNSRFEDYSYGRTGCFYIGS